MPMFVEPDLKVRVGERTLAIAAKRVTSLGSLEKRVREARHQIDDATQADETQQGIIAMDLTPAFGLDIDVPRVLGKDELGTLYAETWRRTAREGRRVGEWASRGSRVRAAAAYM